MPYNSIILSKKFYFIYFQEMALVSRSQGSLKIDGSDSDNKICQRDIHFPASFYLPGKAGNLDRKRDDIQVRN